MRRIGEGIDCAIGRLAAHLPEHVRDSLTPAQVSLRVHGVQLDESTCGGCGTVLQSTDYPFSRGCHQCHRPLTRRCLTPGCVAVLEPVARDTLTRRGDTRRVWDEPATYCETCRRRQGQDHRLALWRDRVPHHIRGFATSGWAELAWHTDATQRSGVKGWLSRQLRAPADQRRPTLYVCGPTGVGKSVALARLAHSLIVEERATDMLWVREADLIQAHRHQFARGDDGDTIATRGRDLLRRATEAPLLVLDELFSLGREPYSSSNARELGSVLYDRLESRRLTLIASNEPGTGGTLALVEALVARTFDDRVGSRFARGAEVVRAYGPDMRRGTG